MSKKEAERFEKALHQAARGEKIEARLTHLVRTVQQVSLIAGPPPPPPNRLLHGRQRFLTEAARRDARKTPERVGQVWKPHKFRLATVLVAMVLVCGLVLGPGQAAAGSLPGDFLYDLKLVGEGFRLALTTNPEARANLNLERVEERLDEITKLVAQGQALDEPTVERATERFQTAVEVARESRQAAEPWVFERLQEMVTANQRFMQSTLDGLPEAEQQPVRHLLALMEQVRRELSADDEAAADAERERLRHETPSVPVEIPDPAEQPGAGPLPQAPSGEPKPTDEPAPGLEPEAPRGEPRSTDHPDMGTGPQPIDQPGEPNSPDEPEQEQGTGSGEGQGQSPAVAPGAGRSAPGRAVGPSDTPTPTAIPEIDQTRPGKSPMGPDLQGLQNLDLGSQPQSRAIGG